MSNSFVARVCGMCQLLKTYISCVLLVTTVAINKTASPACEDLACENSNVCQSSVINNTHTGHTYCSCRGEWAGLRCELKLFVSAQSVTSQMAVLKLHGRPWPGRKKPRTSHDLFVSEVTISIWNFNISDQCLLLQQNMSAENAIILTGLDRHQEYFVCVANGFVDSCSFFQQQPLNIPKLSTCIYFETKLVDVESFDIGLIIVPSAFVMFIVVIIIFVYCQRNSLLVQLFLDRVCCRSCYCLRKHIQRRQCLTYRQSNVSGEMLMPGDVSTDFESVCEAHSRATEESNGRGTYSSNASSSPCRSACSLHPDGSVSIPALLDHNTFLYENQSLIPPLYSPQDHKVMTLTYIDDDLIPLNTGHTVENHINSLYPEPYSVSLSQNQGEQDRMFKDSKSGCDIVQELFVIPGPVMQKFTPNQIPECILFKETPGSGQYTGPVKQQLLVHPYLHRPYHKSHILHRPDHSNPNSSQFSHNEHVRFREPNFSALRQRPLSLPATYLCQDTSGIGEFTSSNYNNHCLKSPRKSSLRNIDANILSPVPAWSTNYNFRNQVTRSNSDTNNIKINHFLCNPQCHQCAVKDNEQTCVSITFDNKSIETFESNTLPRSKKPKSDPPFTRNSIPDSLLNTSFKDHQRPLIAAPPKRPTNLNISNPIQKPKSSYQAQEVKFASTETSISSESKSHSKPVRSLISHFEHNLSFLKPLKSNRPSEEEKEYQDLLSPLAAERVKASKKSRHSNAHKTSSGNKTPSSNDTHNRNSTFGPPVFEGHPSEHIILPFTTDNQDDGEDLSDTSILNVRSGRSSRASNVSKSGGSVISSFDDDDTNLVTPFDTDNSSDDDTYKGIQSLTASNDTLQDLEVEHLLLNAEGVSSFEHPVLQNDSKLGPYNEESEKLLNHS